MGLRRKNKGKSYALKMRNDTHHLIKKLSEGDKKDSRASRLSQQIVEESQKLNSLQAGHGIRQQLRA